MEDCNDLEQVTGSPSSGESGFVHVEPIDSASIDGSSINQVNLMITNFRLSIHVHKTGTIYNLGQLIFQHYRPSI